VDNLSLEISYYNDEENLMKKIILKNRLTGAIPPGESRKYKIRLNGNVVNERNAEYPYLQWGDVNEFDVKVVNVKLGRRP